MVLELVPKDDVAAGDKKGQAETPIYTGPERRREQRRSHADRREMVRFEARADRRSGNERRDTVALWKNRDF